MDIAGRVGAIAVVGALLLRLGGSSLPQKVVNELSDPEVARLVLLTQTGYWSALPALPDHEAESVIPEPPIKEIIRPAFHAEDATLVTLHSSATKSPDIPALLTQPLNWDLYGQEPTVLIIHTHTSESYTYTGGYKEDGAYRTLDEDYNMLTVGQALAERLEQAGIGVVHDRNFHDYPSYNGAYVHARTELEAYLTQYPSIKLVLDLHRDAVADARGNQLAYTCGEYAQFMLVVGTNHENWTENMALAVKLQARLQQLRPGICRPMAVRNQRFNQDLCVGALLVEVGAAGNTLDQALASIPTLSQAIIDLAEGTA